MAEYGEWRAYPAGTLKAHENLVGICRQIAQADAKDAGFDSCSVIFIPNTQRHINSPEMVDLVGWHVNE